jgi:hypothetical protein
MTSNAKAAGRFGKQDFRYVAAEDVYICPAGQRLAYFFTTEDKGLVLRRYRTSRGRTAAVWDKGFQAFLNAPSEHRQVLEQLRVT